VGQSIRGQFEFIKWRGRSYYIGPLIFDSKGVLNLTLCFTRAIAHVNQLLYILNFSPVRSQNRYAFSSKLETTIAYSSIVEQQINISAGKTCADRKQKKDFGHHQSGQDLKVEWTGENVRSTPY
jgi:hypothetical protein